MYSEDLIKEVKELYPNNTEMHKLADEGNVFLGRYLDDSCSSTIPIHAILAATSLEELQKAARLEKRKVDLYKKWCDQDPRKKASRKIQLTEWQIRRERNG